MTKPKTDWRELKAEPHPMSNAGFYGRYLRENEHLSVAEAAERVIARYPHTRPLLERLTRKKNPDQHPGTTPRTAESS